MRFLQTIRFDESDSHVFDIAATPGEWAVPGGFMFAGIDLRTLNGKTKQAFANGFLSLESFGYSTLTSVVEIRKADYESATKRLADKLRNECGAPTDEAAVEAASLEMKYVLDMCDDVPVNTLFALERKLDANNEIRERFRIIQPDRGQMHTKIWEIEE